MGRLIDEDVLIDSIPDLSVFEQEDFGTPDMIRLIEDSPTVEAIPKDQYEARLKADMIAMLTEISLEIEEHKMTSGVTNQGTWNECIACCSRVIQQKIDKLKESD